MSGGGRERTGKQVSSPRHPISAAAVAHNPAESLAARYRPHGSAESGFQPAVEGLRAVAVIAVMLFHAGVPFVSGGYIGVDVFFVISGYLITGLLLRELRRTGTVSLRRFYARRARRLLPAATLVLVVVAYLSWLLVPVGQREDVGLSVMAAAVFAANWVFAAQAGDYFNQGTETNPVLHFWSLSVEEQFYLIWPGLLLLLALPRLWRSLGTPRVRIAVGVAALAAASLAYAIWLTSTDPAAAYFVTPARMWELAAGALLALASPVLPRIPRWIGVGLGTVGLLGIGTAALLFNATTPFPGTAALLPVVATMMVLAASRTGGAGPVLGWLGHPVMVRIGAMSYSLYLWHWPFAVFAPLLFPASGAWIVTLAVLLSVLPAAASFFWLENPIRHARPLVADPTWSLLVGVLCIAMALGSGAVLRNAAIDRSDNVEARQELLAGLELAQGAAALSELSATAPQPAVAIVPAPEVANKDVGQPQTACQDVDEPQLRMCTAGPLEAPIRIALVGDSHAAQWFAALEGPARATGVRVESYTKPACPFAGGVSVLRNSDGKVADHVSCTDWQIQVANRLLNDPPDLLVAAARDGRTIVRGPEGILDPWQSSAPLAEGMAKQYADLVAAGISVVHIRDTPDMTGAGDVPDCVGRYRDQLDRCALAASVALGGHKYFPRLQQALPEGATAIDLSDRICTQTHCPAVVGNVMVWRDSHHLTATYARTISPYLWQRLRSAEPSLPEYPGG